MYDVTGQQAVPNPASNDFTPLNLAYSRGESITPRTRNVQADKSTKTREHSVKPPVPLRPKSITKNSESPRTQQHKVQDQHTDQRQTTPIREQRLPPKHAQLSNLGSKATIHSYQHKDSQPTHSTTDIVLPPPPQFQEGNICTALAADQPSYGDYELLSEDSTYNCNIHPTVPPRASSRVHSINQTNYHHRIPVDQLETRIHDNLTVSSQSKENEVKPAVSARRYVYPAHINGYSNSNNMYKHSTHISHHHQYSTEL